MKNEFYPVLSLTIFYEFLLWNSTDWPPFVKRVANFYTMLFF